MTRRLTDMELDALQRRWCLTDPPELRLLLAEVREFRSMFPTEEEASEWEKFHKGQFPEGCGFERQARGETISGKPLKRLYDVAEVEELRAFKAQVDRVRRCSECGDLDGNGGRYLASNCAECGGLP